MDKRLRKLDKTLRQNGCTMTRTKRGHYKVRDGQEHVVCVLPSTSSEYRGWLNGLKQLERAGALTLAEIRKLR